MISVICDLYQMLLSPWNKVLFEPLYSVLRQMNPMHILIIQDQS